MLLIIIILTTLIASALSFGVKKKASLLNGLAIATTFINLVATFFVAILVVRDGGYNFQHYLAVDALGVILMLILAIISFFALWYSAGYLKVEMKKEIIGFHRVRQYFILSHLFISAMFFAIMTTNPILMWIAIEATTLTTVFLVSFYNKPSAMEAAWKYLIINSVGLLLGFFGTLLFLYPSLEAGNHGLISWQSVLRNASSLDPFITKIAFIFILIGYGTKIGFVPMHTWRPDAYSKAPIPVVALLSSSLLNVAFLAVLKFKLITDLVLGKDFSQNLLIFFGLFSIIIAAFNIFGQKNYKRLLAYSSIEHAGIMALGLGFGGAGIFAVILHMIYHSFAKAALFLAVGNVFLKYSSTKIANVRGALKILPVTSVILLVGFLAITGVPPMGIFLTEFSILSAGIGAHWVIVTVVLLALALIFIGFLRSFVAMIFGEDDGTVSVGETGKWTVVPILCLVGLFTILSVYIPESLLSLITSASLIY